MMPLGLLELMVARDRSAVLLNAGPADPTENESSLDRKRKVCLIMIAFVSAVV
jgi:hypothetical protein